MNYRHAFHAGNFADVHKHSVLASILVHLRRKAAAFRIVDTHAGAGCYDLFGPEASRSGEWHDGIEQLWRACRDKTTQTWLAPYLEAVEALNPDGKLRTYPGSPLIAAHLLRSQDRLVACEAEPEAAAALAQVLRGDTRAKALKIDGWMALAAYVPPKERRGLVIIDPPFEDAADFDRLSGALAGAYGKWPTGIYMLWYPIKERAAPDALARRLKKLAIPNMLRSELTLRAPRPQAPLAGSGLILVNPPFRADGDLRTVEPALGEALSREATARTDWLVPPR